MSSCIYVAGFPGGVIMNDFIMKQLACVFYTKAVYFCVYIPRSGASGSDDMHVFNLSRKCQNEFKMIYQFTPPAATYEHSYSYQHLVSSVFLTVAILVEM